MDSSAVPNPRSNGQNRAHPKLAHTDSATQMVCPVSFIGNSKSGESKWNLESNATDDGALDRRSFVKTSNHDHLQSSVGQSTRSQASQPSTFAGSQPLMNDPPHILIGENTSYGGYSQSQIMEELIRAKSRIIELENENQSLVATINNDPLHFKGTAYPNGALSNLALRRRISEPITRLVCVNANPECPPRGIPTPTSPGFSPVALTTNPVPGTNAALQVQVREQAQMIAELQALVRDLERDVYMSRAGSATTLADLHLKYLRNVLLKYYTPGEEHHREVFFNVIAHLLNLCPEEQYFLRGGMQGNTDTGSLPSIADNGGKWFGIF